MPVETVDQSLDTGLVQVSNVARRLSRLLAGEKRVWVYGSESVDNDLSSDGLNGVDDHGHSSWMERFKRLRMESQSATNTGEVDRYTPAAC
jgi:hypothetical protein